MKSGHVELVRPGLVLRQDSQKAAVRQISADVEHVERAEAGAVQAHLLVQLAVVGQQPRADPRRAEPRAGLELPDFRALREPAGDDVVVLQVLDASRCDALRDLVGRRAQHAGGRAELQVGLLGLLVLAQGDGEVEPLPDQVGGAARDEHVAVVRVGRLPASSTATDAFQGCVIPKPRYGAGGRVRSRRSNSERLHDAAGTPGSAPKVSGDSSTKPWRMIAWSAGRSASD